MKASIATAVSIAGVLAAGAGAFALNSAVLSPSPQIESATIASAPATTSFVIENQERVTTNSKTSNSATVPTVNNNPKTSNSATVPTANNNPKMSDSAIVPTVISPQSTSTYKVGDAGRVILALKDGDIEVVNVLPSTGWTAKAPEYDDGKVEVNFRASTMELEFSARVKNGQIEVYVESEHEDADESYEREDDENDRDGHEDDD